MKTKDIKFEGIPLSIGYNSDGEVTDICINEQDIASLLDSYVLDRITAQFYKELDDDNNDRG